MTADFHISKYEKYSIIHYSIDNSYLYLLYTFLIPNTPSNLTLSGILVNIVTCYSLLKV